MYPESITVPQQMLLPKTPCFPFTRVFVTGQLEDRRPAFINAPETTDYPPATQFNSHHCSHSPEWVSFEMPFWFALFCCTYYEKSDLTKGYCSRHHFTSQ